MKVVISLVIHSRDIFEQLQIGNACFGLPSSLLVRNTVKKRGYIVDNYIGYWSYSAGQLILSFGNRNAAI